MNKKAIFIIIGLIIAAALFWVFNPARSHQVETIKPAREKAVQAVYATGTVEASLMIPISPKIAARLMTLEADEGSRVETGAVLAQMEDADLQQNLNDLLAQLDLAEKDLKRSQTLAKSGALSKEGLDRSQAAYKSAAASVERAKAEIGYLKLLAPEAGTIIRRDGEIGEIIPVGTPVFWLTGGDSLRIETEVDEEDISLVQPGQNVVVSADAFPNRIFNGKVKSITPKGDPVARSYRVRITLDENTPLMIGMTAETNIITQIKDDALMIPTSAVKGDNLYVMQGNKPVLTKIKKGISAEKKIEILDGIKEGDIIALRYNDVAPQGKDNKAACNMSTGC